jgi:hypothetical protein
VQEQFKVADGLQDINIQNMNIELVAQMFKNYQSNVLFHLEGMLAGYFHCSVNSLLTPEKLRIV